MRTKAVALYIGVVLQTTHLELISNGFTILEELGESLCANDVPESGLRDQPGGGVIVVHLHLGPCWVGHTEIHYSIHSGRDTVFGKYLSRGESGL